MRILHIEDNPTDADLVARAIARTMPEATVRPASTLGEARELLIRPEDFDIALIDLRLPDGSGLDLVNEIRERELDLAIVMMTGSGDQRAAIAALQSGADDYVSKQVDAYDNLPGTLNGACQRFGERSRHRPHKLRVLYAEHNAADIDLTRRHLDRHSPYIRLTVVPDAVVALSHLPLDPAQDCAYDVVLLDYHLPGLDALETVRTIRNERALEIPIVIVSGQGSEEIAARAIHLGVDDYIAKHSGYLHELGPTLEKVHRQAQLLREQAVLQQTSQHLAYMLEGSPVVLYTLTINGPAIESTWVSANITRLFGFSEVEALRAGWWLDHLHPDDRDGATRAMSALVAQGSVSHDYRFFDNAGQVRWIRDELRLLSDAGEPTNIALGAWQDITSRKISEQTQQTRMGALDSLLNGASLHAVLNTVAEGLEQIRPKMRVSIMMRDEHDGRLYTGAAPSLPTFYNEAVDGLSIAVGQGSCGTSAALAEPVIVSDVLDHAYWQGYRELATRADIRSCWSVPIMDENANVCGTFGIYHATVQSPSAEDMTLIGEFSRIAGLAVQRARADSDLRQAAAVFNSTREGVVITDLTPKIIAVNPAYSEITGFGEKEVVGCNPAIVQSGRQDEAFYQAMWASLINTGHWQGEIWNRRKDGEIYPQLLTISIVRDIDGQPKNYVGVMTDISQIKKSEANLERLSHYDPLTNLPNRLLLHSRLEHALTHAQREKEQIAVLFLDLDRFKNINDSLGHPSGDALLQGLTKRIKDRLRAEDTFGRLGGDEFVIVLSDIQRPDDAAAIARQALSLLETPFSLPGQSEIYVGASIGISLFPQDGETADDLIRHADAAMSQAKDQGRNTLRFYTPELTETVNDRVTLESRLRRALAQQEFVLVYQPQVDIASGRLMGCEALIRWHDGDRGMISPEHFIPLAEDTGLIVPMGAWVLQTACAQFRAWLDIAETPFCMAINLSARQLQHPDIVNSIAQAIDDNRLPPDQLKIEITESMIMGHGEDAVSLLEAIKSLGVKLSIDDFGTGYSSLAYLKRFPIDELKIDRGFVSEIPHNQSDAEIAATIISMAHNLKLTVVAEGVETDEQARFLAAQGCKCCQGYLYHRPLTPADFAALLG